MKIIIKSLLVSLISISLLTASSVESLASLVRGGKNSKKVFNEILASHPLVIVIWTVKNCGPCKRVAPKFEALAKEYAGKARFVSIDAVKFDHIASTYSTKSLPTFLIFSGAQLLKKITGSGKFNQIKPLIAAQLRAMEATA